MQNFIETIALCISAIFAYPIAYLLVILPSELMNLDKPLTALLGIGYIILIFFAAEIVDDIRSKKGSKPVSLQDSDNLRI